MVMRSAHESDVGAGLIHFADYLRRKGEPEPPMEQIATVYCDLAANALSEACITDAVRLPAEPPDGAWRNSDDRRGREGFPGARNESWWLESLGGSSEGACLVGTDRDTGEIIGYIGTGGFRQQLPPREEWFAIAGHQVWNRAVNGEHVFSAAIINCGRKVYHVDVGTHEVRQVVADLAGPASAAAVTYQLTPIPPGEPPNTLILRTRDSIELVDLDARGMLPAAGQMHHRTFAIPFEPARRNVLGVPAHRRWIDGHR